MIGNIVTYDLFYTDVYDKFITQSFRRSVVPHSKLCFVMQLKSGMFKDRWMGTLRQRIKSKTGTFISAVSGKFSFSTLNSSAIHKHYNCYNKCLMQSNHVLVITHRISLEVSAVFTVLFNILQHFLFCLLIRPYNWIT